MNRFAFGDAHEYDAIADRAHLVYFDPTPAEVHRNAAVWFWDQEIYNYIGQHLNLIDPTNSRPGRMSKPMNAGKKATGESSLNGAFQPGRRAMGHRPGKRSAAPHRGVESGRVRAADRLAEGHVLQREEAT